MTELETFCALLEVLGVEYATGYKPWAGTAVASKHFRFMFSDGTEAVKYGWVRPCHDGREWTTYFLRPTIGGAPVEDPSACSRGLMAYPPPWAVRMGF